MMELKYGLMNLQHLLHNILEVILLLAKKCKTGEYNFMY